MSRVNFNASKTTVFPDISMDFLSSEEKLLIVDVLSRDDNLKQKEAARIS